tara:strand:+ start:337 stop:1341 length:1005 start_codon:yes stop_codon:yes gene_type:complete
MTVNTKPCICCDTKKHEKISSIGRDLSKLETIMCTGCGLIRSNPIPTKDELSKFYKEKYRSIYKLTYSPKIKHTIRYASGTIYHLNTILSFIDYPHNKKLLDIGSGSGELLYFAKKAGFDVYGIEPNKGYAEFCINKLFLPVFNGTYEEADIKMSTYDVIFMNEVLEHMPDPMNVLRDIHSYLKDDGILIVNVPDIEISKHSPIKRFHYAHIYNYNHLCLKKIIEKNRYKILNKETNTTSIIARKSKIEHNDIKYNFQKNYLRIKSNIFTNSNLKHYFSIHPYYKVFKKMIQYPREFLISLFINDHKHVLDRVFQSGQGDIFHRFFAFIEKKIR